MPPPLIVRTRGELIEVLVSIFVVMPLMMYFMIFREPPTQTPHADRASLQRPQLLISAENGVAKFKAVDGTTEQTIEVDTRHLQIGAIYALEDHSFQSKWGILHSYSLKMLSAPKSFAKPQPKAEAFFISPHDDDEDSSRYPQKAIKIVC